MHKITPHVVIRDAARAAEWYGDVFGGPDRGEVARAAAEMFGG
jgi:hypothetical protein